MGNNLKNIIKSKKKKQSEEKVIIRYAPDLNFGLSKEQVEERKKAKLSNNTKIKTSNSYLKIIFKNIFTFFNLIWIVIACALIAVRDYGDLMFLFVVVANTAISIIQEVRAKVTVEHLSLVSTPKVRTLRHGEEILVKSENLVLDDIILLESGNQIPADCIILDGNVEANESLLTGESNSIKKSPGSMLLAGSFLVSGVCKARIEKIGKQNYIQTIAESTKDFKASTSNLFRDINHLIKYIAIALVPLGIVTFIKEYIFLSNSIEDSIINTSGALTGMIPAGMYLLITIGLAVGVVKLSRKKALIKDVYSIEMLARTNVLCLDKTGTITDGTMKVVNSYPQANYKETDVEKIMSMILENQKTSNATSVAFLAKYSKFTEISANFVLEFSSERKFSATTIKNKTYFLGAVSFIGCKVTKEQNIAMQKCMEKGYRVIALVETCGKYDEKKKGKEGKLITFFTLEDHIRKDAVATIRWFKENNVEIKIISGDDALTVSKIAKRVGVQNSDKYISLENMSLQEVAEIADKFTVFGRVTPEQKHILIKTLKNKGKVVAMTGDGVNDTLALKEADCSIAMADGSEVARNISNIVLLESNFSCLPHVVKEGRQVVNNVQNSSVLYLMKTLFTIMLCAITFVFKSSYPFSPRQLLPLEMFVIGLGSLILTFEPNDKIISGNFIPKVMKKTIPRSILMIVSVLAVLVLYNFGVISSSESDTLYVLVLTFTGYVNLFFLCYPFTWLKAGIVATSLVCLIGVFAGFSNYLIASPTYSTKVILVLLTIIVLYSLLYVISISILNKFFSKKKIKRYKLKEEMEIQNRIAENKKQINIFEEEEKQNIETSENENKHIKTR